MATDKLNEKQRRFAEEYMVDMNATRAAIRAGYSEKTAPSQGSRLLKNAKVGNEITRLRQGLTDRTAITAERVLEEYRRVAFASMPAYIESTDGTCSLQSVADLSEEDAAAISEVVHTAGPNGTTKVKLHNKLAALDALARHLGLNEKDNSRKVDLEVVAPQLMNFGSVTVKF